MTSEETLWDVEEVAKYLKVSKDTIYRWLDTKNMPSKRIGKKWLFRKEDIDAWIDECDKRESGKH